MYPFQMALRAGFGADIGAVFSLLNCHPILAPGLFLLEVSLNVDVFGLALLFGRRRRRQLPLPAAAAPAAGAYVRGGGCGGRGGHGGRGGPAQPPAALPGAASACKFQI